MRRLARALFFGGGLALAGLLAACGGTGGGGLYGAPGPSSTPVASLPAAQSIVGVGTAQVAGMSEMVLTDHSGKTLYYFMPDTSQSSACTGSCQSIWPAVIAPSSGTPTSSATLPGTLAAFDGANGHQLTYNGHPLYTYSGDAAPGDANGQRKLGKWFVA